MEFPAGLNFLLVEDMVSDSFLLQRQLKKISDNPEIRFVETELSLTNALKTFIPDILITDFSLVGMDAFDVIRITKEVNPKIPVVVITGNLKNEADKERLLENGASGFFLKEPINTLNDRLGPLFHSILIEKHADLKTLDRERKKYKARKSQSDFLRAHDYVDEDEKNNPNENMGFWKSLSSMLGFKGRREEI